MSTTTLPEVLDTSELSRRDQMRARYGTLAPLLAIGGGVLLLLSGLLSWSYDDRILGDISIRFFPAGIQIYAMVIGVVAIALGALLRVRPAWLNPGRGLAAVGWGSMVFVVVALVTISRQAGGSVNINEGGWVALLGALLVFAAGWVARRFELDVRSWPRLPGWAEILIIVVMMAVLLFTTAYTLGLDDSWTFVCLLVALLTIAVALVGSGFGEYIGFVGANNRRVLLLSALLVAFLFPFTQDGSDANMSIATQILIFAATALGLNIVVGLAGLLDLGYIAFLGTGAYVGAMLSQSTFATIGWKPPFIIVMLCGMAVASTFGLIIGSPTLRVSGDYLAIVTLGFGEIFRLAMFNLDGTNGPDLTNGPNGIPAIPDLNFFGFDFGKVHTVAGIPLGRFSNYYFLLLLLIAFVILVFSRLNDSRIGRGWVAIREDERAAEAMGVNVFGLKLLAFAVGAALAGLAGTIKAHQDTSVTPDQYIFLESAFLLAAVVLGGMGTVAGVLVGATILKLLPRSCVTRPTTGCCSSGCSSSS
ncbi:branched-chain amino acid ABC transporter permease [Phycicoccus sp. HDW14]|uniref:branched-chain amino acid ABC transporter permease n=1 Tax=Phycicoccus sp. HDW14 TaxID=2714941 RepID=UPI001F0D9B0B|nr:branched-chain amino acid ABC transporter permease [Phycicoccus sp. HDW14]